MRHVATTMITGDARTGPARQTVALWWLEIDDAGVPRREIGLDAAGKLVVAAPLGGDRGLWTDSPVTLSADEYESVDCAAFEAAWSKAAGR